MPAPKKPAEKGEITYHVGWKKGTISTKAGADHTPQSRQDRVLHGLIWRRAAFFPASFDMFLICALPIVSFIAILALVYLLNHS